MATVPPAGPANPPAPPPNPLVQQIDDVLRQWGLPPLPPPPPPLPPLPGLPPLPIIDPRALLQPLTDALGSFGSGKLGGPGRIDPSQVISGVSTALQMIMTITELGIMGYSLLQGDGADNLKQKNQDSQRNSEQLMAQGRHISGVLGSAAQTVAMGASQVAGIIAEYIATAIGLGPTLVTPVGQALLVEQSAEAGGRAAAVTASTHVQLGVHAGEMATAGLPVSLTKAPRAEQLLAMLTVAEKATSVLGQAAGSFADIGAKFGAAPDTPALSTISAPDPPAPLDMPVAPPAVPSPLTGEPPRRLTAYGGGAVTTREIAGRPVAEPVSATGKPVAESLAEPMPMAPGALGSGSGTVLTTDEARRGAHNAASAENGREIVGEVAGLAYPTVGETGWT
ncbi:hypothetical protein [Nocardia sp. NPDC127526]|uniref:hypothetical protein n=1 Tax=Nocardia sp. NPDC127526 TaxID=3345393 RepID=UPI0036307C39